MRRRRRARRRAGILPLLQRSIERLHAVESGLDVRAYVVSEEVRRALPGAREDVPEQLFVRADAEGVELALYIDPVVVGRLEQDCPHRRLHAGNFESYCIALEGVSHFVFLAWRARLGRPVTPLELEIQAEVDKFVSAWLLLAEQGHTLVASASLLGRQLFESYELREQLQPDEVSRYRVATQVARRYCAGLAERYGRDQSASRITRDVREFYRSGLADKLRAA